MKPLRADLAVIGAGSGGLTVAAGAAQLGLKVVLFERGEMGGDCLNCGCVPSKALISAAKAAHAAREASRLGVEASPRIDFGQVMQHVRGVIASIAPHDSQARFEGLGVTVIREPAAFAGPRTLYAGDHRVTARKIVVATGSRPSVPDIEGLAETPYLTNETIFSLQALPRRLVILGGGPIGLELGQAFRRLGSEVVVVQRGQLLPREDVDLTAPLFAQLRSDGLDVMSRTEAYRVTPTALGVCVYAKVDGMALRIEGSHLLVAAGRTPNLEGLDLEAGRVAFGPRGITTDRSLRSVSNRAVFAVGDVAGRDAFTHAAGAHGSLFIRRALFAQPVDADRLVVPRVTYTDPEVAVVGLTEAQARARHGERVRVVRAAFERNDRARAEGDTAGEAKLVLDRRGRLLGAAIVGTGAGDLIQPWVLAMTARLRLGAVAGAIAPYPTRSEISKQVAGAVFTPLVFSKSSRRLVGLLKRLA